MEQNNKKILVIAIILAIITSAILFGYLKKIESASKSIQYVTINVAVKKIEAKSVIKAEDLKEIKVEKSMVNTNALLNKSDIINKTTKEVIYEGEQILRTRLAEGGNAELAFQIPQGKRAVTINVNEASSVGYFVNPGDYVDIILTLQKDDQGSGTLPNATRTLLQNALVLGVGQVKDAADRMTNKTEKKDAKNATASGETDATKTVTIAVTPQEAERIALAEEKGILKLALRPVGDNSVINSVPVMRNDLLQ